MDTVFKLSAVFCMCGLVTSEVTPSSAPSSTNVSLHQDENANNLVNEIIDLALKKLRVETVEPITLQDEVKNFSKKILTFPVKGQLILYDGKLWGMKNIKRAGDATFHFHHITQIEVNCSFTFKTLNFIYNYQATLLKKFTTNGEMDGDISQLMVDVGLYINLKEKTIDLTRLKLINAKSLGLRLNSKKVLDKAINVLLKLVMSSFKTIILSQMETELQSFLYQKIHFHF